MEQDIQSVLYSEAQLRERVQELGRQITEDYRDRDLILVCVLKGSCVFMADLMRAIRVNAAIDFMCVSSYGAGTSTRGAVQLIKDLGTDVAGKDVLLVEDILDSGVTLSFLRDHIIRSRGPASFGICTLFDKPERRRVDVQPDYVGFVIPDAFIVGYGLDYAERYRNLPYVGILKPEVYS